MVHISGGSFLMGSPDSDPDRRADEDQYSVEVSDFRISRYPITNAQYASFLTAMKVPATGEYNGKRLISMPHPFLNCTYANNEYTWNVHDGGENHPVSGISWQGADAFARWHGGSLPSEAQWEYACRAGTKTPYYIDLSITSLDKYAWYIQNNNTAPGNGIGTKPVGGKYYNPYGLCDMMGNVWEWCLDWYGTSTDKRVLRGGAFDSPATDCRSAARFSAEPENAGANYGFRIVME
ncbi:SUMF1/EgtB/PvdO family nonheme iron enzyme [Bacteroides sp. 224]|uniref:formylglycine-generating enzyme family protein n=1 Tax=Bacteroides sp. 224 TaxID=2302936 RepID=UPI0013D43967|nr:SUMF1/EgtB/PvdO family nonheme iron enzyme [Bacteroides sp. 224]NDV64758.1 hypothetical protein [Bacteroides sp. 224]